MKPITDCPPADECGLGLIGLLLTLIVLGAMAAVVVKAVDGAGVRSGVPLLATTLPLDAVASGAGPQRAAGLAGEAAPAACAQSVATIEAALAAARVVQGRYPATLAELAGSGFLGDVPAGPGYTYAPEVVGGQPSGRVLVNGLPAEEGCRAGPKKG